MYIQNRLALDGNAQTDGQLEDIMHPALFPVSVKEIYPHCFLTVYRYM